VRVIVSTDYEHVGVVVVIVNHVVIEKVVRAVIVPVIVTVMVEGSVVYGF
jgi:hypothetical protein